MGEEKRRPAYEFVDMKTKGEGAVQTAFANQVAYCEHAGAHITARVVAKERVRLLGSWNSASGSTPARAITGSASSRMRPLGTAKVSCPGLSWKPLMVMIDRALKGADGKGQWKWQVQANDRPTNLST